VKKNSSPESVAQEIFKVVEADLRDRRGIRQEWDNIDEETQTEIRDTNVANIVKILKRIE
jgi:hypothetical protein